MSAGDSIARVNARHTLVTGGTRSGKSAVAEHRLPPGPCCYLATGPLPAVEDADWAERVRLHRARRPSDWTTVETTDLPPALAALSSPALVDCLGTWLTAQLDDLAVWDAAPDDQRWQPLLSARVDALVAAIAGCPQPLVLVSNEVGQSLVSLDRGARIFTDQLGWLNQKVAGVCATVVLVVAGCELTIKGLGATPD